jgi:MFS family permease
MILNFSMIAMGIQLVTTPLFAALSDRIGRKPVMLAGTAFLAVYAFVFFPLLQTKSDGMVLLALVVAYNATGAIHGPMAAYFAELYDARMRMSGASLGIQIGHVLGGGVAPFLTTALYAAGGSVLPVALYLAGTAVITLVALLMLPETAPRIVAMRRDRGAPGQALATARRSSRLADRLPHPPAGRRAERRPVGRQAGVLSCPVRLPPR